MSFANSVCSYPDRGHYGQSSYRGNCSGHVIRDFFESYAPKKGGLCADPSIGGGTSVDVAREMGLRFTGTDLHQGFNLLRDDFGSFLGEQAHAVFWHPPYADMISYSGNMWGQPDKWDMSRMNLHEFTEALELAIMNIHDAVEKGGHYGILMGNLRRKGQYYNLSSLVERVSPGRLTDEIIKIQHNCVSDSRQYSGRVVRIAHEKLLVFKKGAEAALFFLSVASKRAEALVSTTWRAAVRKAMMGREMSLQQLYDAIQPYAETTNNNNWQAKVRQVVQDERYFERVERGVYRLAA